MTLLNDKVGWVISLHEITVEGRFPGNLRLRKTRCGLPLYHEPLIKLIQDNIGSVDEAVI